jgi:hypothetical protein
MDNDILLPLLTTSLAGSWKLLEYWPDAPALSPVKRDGAEGEVLPDGAVPDRDQVPGGHRSFLLHLSPQV